MDKVIIRAKDSIKKILESQPKRRHLELVDVLNLLNQLLGPNFQGNVQARLFCRQLKRLMDYNDSIRNDIWQTCHHDLHYIVMDPNGEKDKGDNWERFLERMDFENKLEQRELKFQETFRERKSLSQLFFEHKEFLQEYFQKCIFLHSKVQVRGLIDNIDNLLSMIHELTGVSLTSESQKRLEEKLKCIEINFDYSTKSLKCYQYNSSRVDNFLPSIEQIGIEKSNKTEKIANVLQYNRWIVILGDPGSAKTTLLRWITRIFSEAALRNDEEVVLDGNSCVSLRIPILIRIGEFASWLIQDKTKRKTLIDYIGEHTWFSEPYCDIASGNVLKELVYHGHALILLDGLDEIPEVGRRGEIVDLVRKFIVEYVHGPDFFSAFDHFMFETESIFDSRKLVQIQPPKKSGGNQIILTSRVVGYQLYPLIGPMIQNYSLLLMNHQEAKKFVKTWMVQVEKCLFDDLLKEDIVKTLSEKRCNTIEKMFENNSAFLMSTPSVLSLICTFIFQSFDEVHLQSRVEVYHHTFQAALRFWRSQESCISEDILTNFLIELAAYLHLQSPSGLIDAYDMERLCCLILKQQGVSNNRIELRVYANKLLSLLDLNIGVVAERGLQVFGFLHLSFQEYFVAQAFVRNSSIDEIVKRIITFTINPRFRESLLLALGWISWKWSFDDYDRFCNLLVTSTVDYAIPVGTLLLFDAFDDLKRLPSNSVIFTALNNLLNHRSWDIRSKYFLRNLSQLSTNIIQEWMELYVKDDKCLLNFCQCFVIYRKEDVYMTEYAQKLPSIVYQQLWSCHDISTSAEFVIDQTLRRIMISGGITDQIFNKELSEYLLSDDICQSNIHPLMLTVINALCGGIHFGLRGGMFNISFSPKYMHRESSILTPIIEYFNNEESHSIKIQMVVNYYQNFIENCLPSNTSIDIVDTFIALICLQGVSQPLIYQKYKEYKALPLALERFKWIWFYFKESSSHIRADLGTVADIYFIEDKIKPIMNVFLSQSKGQISSFSLACAAACKKLRMLDVTNSLELNSSYEIDQSEFIYFIDENKLDLITQNISSYNILENQPFFLLNFLPQSLRQLYSCTIIAPINKTDSLPFVVFLSQCLIHLEGVDHYDSNFYFALVMLQSLLKEHMLENYASGLLWEKYFDTETIKSNNTVKFLEAMNNRKLLDPFHMDEVNNLELFIEMERQRIFKANLELQNQEKDVKIFAALISLARLFQVQYRLRKYKAIKSISIPLADSNDVYVEIMNIHSPILRIIALNIILKMENPLIFNKEQRNQLRWYMIFLLYSILPNLSLLTSTLLFIQCFTIHQMFPITFEYMSNIIGKKFNQKQSQGQEAAYIALKQINNSDLSFYLSEFAKQRINLSDVLQFNSTIFFDYITTFDSLNSILLSVLYLNELIFDVQSLKMYTKDNYMKNISPWKDFEEFWIELFKVEKIMSFKIATSITKYLEIFNKQEIHTIIEYISQCSLIEKNTLSIMEKWLDYRMDKGFKIFSQYAALQLIIEGSKKSILMDIIKDMFSTDNCFRLKSIVERLFNSQVVNSIIFRKILVILQENIRYSSKIFVSIDCTKNLKLILNLEYQRITSNLSKISTKPFLLMIKSCSKDLQFYLRTCINENIIKEEYIAIIIKWIIENFIFDEMTNEYDWIFTLLHNQHFPQIQKAIVNGLNSMYLRIRQKNIFLEDNVIKNLEKVICSWDKYSKDVVAICLLAYGNCLVQLKNFNIDRNISDEMMDKLKYLSETLFPEIISIRASFCLIFIEQYFVQALNWFKNKWNITLKETYNILLNLTLYEIREHSVGLCMEEFIEQLDKHSDVLMNTFVTDLYNYLCNNNNRNYLSDPLPDFVILALKVQEKDWNKFHNAIEKSSFGEKRFINELSIHVMNNSRDSSYSLLLYIDFGILTNELVDMLERCQHNEIFKCVKRIKQVSNRDVIEKFVQLIDSNMSDEKFKSYSRALEFLAGIHDVSLLEIHKRISRMISMSYDSDGKWSNREQDIFKLLLNISCFNNEEVSFNFNQRICLDLEKIFLNSEKIRLNLERIFITKNKINEDFHREIEYLDKKSALFFRENPFLTDFSSISN